MWKVLDKIVVCDNERFRARLNVVCVTDKLTGELKCDGWPEVKVALAPVGALRPNATESNMQQLISDIVVNALRSTNLQFSLAHYPTCPRLRRYVETPGPRLPLHYDSMLQQDRQMYTSTPNSTAGSVTLLGDKRLLVKLVCAKDLGGKTGCIAPYCVVEMDEPPQKNQTAFKKDTNNPQRGPWRSTTSVAHSLSSSSSSRVPTSRTWAPGPSRSRRFVGFLFICVVCCVNCQEPKKSIKVEITDSGKFIEVERAEADTEVPQESGKIDESETESELPVSPSPNASPGKTVRIKENGAKANGDTEQGDYVQHQNESSPPEPAPRKRRRDFFGTIKRRLGRSRTRGASLDLTDSEVENQSRIRSISAERNAHEKALSIPNRNVYSAGASPAQSGDESRTSRRSSLSEVSGFSTASARTFIHEASTLVLETIEAGIKKHYLVPLTIAQRSRWRRKGVKLHIYNEHTFIAKHLSGGTVCEVCTKTIARRLGKQGYECRDCTLKCHKHCHVKVATNCPRSTVHNMEL
ncbi:hypothetical protein B5X24_HaOG212880 [Helicoverpa armigera]|uniref:Phorbol-ester/DAG-type domain-containing protein n=1 Tax=Helicoverpa armigera TaxID=29058 RepID=A0A2W1B680_HELAM|nr:hypothetical protein B5X24_HaOG212880 [Helicoverpa armigera]